MERERRGLHWNQRQLWKVLFDFCDRVVIHAEADTRELRF
jgi:hypothetical protein